MQNKGAKSYQGTVAALAAALTVAVLASVTLGRYPIGVKELWGILLSRWVEMEPYWSKTQESLLLQK